MIINEQYQYVRRIAFVYNNLPTRDSYREKAREVAQFCQRWKAEYQEIAGSDAYIHQLVHMIKNPTNANSDFLRISRGKLSRASSSFEEIIQFSLLHQTSPDGSIWLAAGGRRGGMPAG